MAANQLNFNKGAIVDPLQGLKHTFNDRGILAGVAKRAAADEAQQRLFNRQDARNAILDTRANANLAIAEDQNTRAQTLFDAKKTDKANLTKAMQEQGTTLNQATLGNDINTLLEKQVSTIYDPVTGNVLPGQEARAAEYEKGAFGDQLLNTVGGIQPNINDRLSAIFDKGVELGVPQDQLVPAIKSIADTNAVLNPTKTNNATNKALLDAKLNENKTIFNAKTKGLRSGTNGGSSYYNKKYSGGTGNKVIDSDTFDYIVSDYNFSDKAFATDTANALVRSGAVPAKDIGTFMRMINPAEQGGLSGLKFDTVDVDKIESLLGKQSADVVQGLKDDIITPKEAAIALKAYSKTNASTYNNSVPKADIDAFKQANKEAMDKYLLGAGNTNGATSLAESRDQLFAFANKVFTPPVDVPVSDTSPSGSTVPTSSGNNVAPQSLLPGNNGKEPLPTTPINDTLMTLSDRLDKLKGKTDPESIAMRNRINKTMAAILNQ